MAENERGPLLNAEQAAEYLGGPPVTASTLTTLARKQQIGHVKIGRATMFPRTELDEYIDSHTIKPTENPWGLTDGALRTIREGRPSERLRRRG